MYRESPKMRTGFIKILALIVCGFYLLSMAGCSSETDKKETAQKAEVKKSDIVIGSSDNTAKPLQITNKTGYDIKSVDYDVAGDGNFVNLPFSGDSVFKADKTADLWLPIIDGTKEDNSSTDSAGTPVNLKEQRDLRITFSDDSQHVLYRIAKADYEKTTEISLEYSIEDKVIYISAKDSTGSTFTTLENQKAVAAQKESERTAAEAAAAEEAARQHEAELAAQRAAEIARQRASEQSYTPPRSSNPQPNNQGTVQKSEDSCIQPGEVNWR
ncbi:hypothetical protein [uncultured Arcanobacterium sp.]|uniref:hypothetical protein n=1 Tax=uncultured Arcanobacterium sp. TaxID=487520 RepID=UPI00261C4E52|nr:hypothetical protein [uncultured Arcanobacterium sp.]